MSLFIILQKNTQMLRDVAIRPLYYTLKFQEKKWDIFLILILYYDTYFYWTSRCRV